MTAIADKLRAAGPVLAADSALYIRAVDCMIAADEDIGRAAARLYEEITVDPDLGEALARWYLSERIAVDRSGIRPETGDGDHIAGVAQCKNVPDSSASDSGHAAAGPAEPIAEGMDRFPNDNHGTRVPSLREPDATQRRASRVAALAAARTVFDSVTLRGRPLRAIAFGELARMLSDNERENAIIRQIMRRFANADPLARLPDLLKEDDVNRIVQKAAELADAL